ncbi:alpha/beta hydrolase [Undibacterium sp.]|uniref:alpha/beta hydrolase n=1 Tax=Undibacterium sp. TaxID=1914977 RepID=UPI00272FBEA3|nr:alpha/beta hydrolase [Undibacterium sp.]MDP1978598.1 alpha/beta hydrolase [Undibacterium sp.]
MRFLLILFLCNAFFNDSCFAAVISGQDGNNYQPEFSLCSDAGSDARLKGSICAHVNMPLSHGKPVTEQPDKTISLFVRKFPAAGIAKGQLWLIAGGPGESGASLYSFVERFRDSFPGFDLLVPDHRGTGFSSRLCPQEEAVDSPGGSTLVAQEWQNCFSYLQQHPGYARQFSLTNAAHDLRQLILQNQDGKPVYVYAVSYGTQLILRALQIAELPLDGLILDSLVPLQTAGKWDLSQRSFVLDDIGRKVLAGPTETSYKNLLARLAANPALTKDIPGREVRQFFGRLLDVPAARQHLPALIREMEQGTQAGELQKVLGILGEKYSEFGAYPQLHPSIPLVSIISHSENNLRPGLTHEVIQQENSSLLFTSPLPGLLINTGLPAYEPDQYFGKVPASLPPSLVLQGTWDPKTHYEGAVEHIASLKKTGKLTLVTVNEAPHFILWTAPGCFAKASRAFLAGQVLMKECQEK